MTTTAVPLKPGPAPPAACPFCQSAQIGTTSKVVSDLTYWRCGTCGQIWNQLRLLAWKTRR
jgi:transposase-like protein